MYDDFVLAQLLGFVSFGLGMTAFYQRDDKRLKQIMVVFNLNHAIHYVLLAAMPAALSSLLSGARTWLSIRYRSHQLAWVFIILNLFVGWFVATDWTALFPMAGFCLGTYALFCLKGLKMRFFFVIGALCWLANNIIVGSWGGVLLETCLLAMNLRTMIVMKISPV
ncbi:YgjV family protein [Thaumasiovibrio subtropicus]|uniref:YgjV family protein n=1 Tax=Thaumasiovibrio subtropicus TaxID=1891207 RepID=UPI000B351DA1|nr:YgjV family protein [Thaumasiovibrio subtropicus]